MHHDKWTDKVSIKMKICKEKLKLLFTCSAVSNISKQIYVSNINSFV